MRPTILIRESGPSEAWKEPEKKTYESEFHLQTTLSTNSTLIPGISENSVNVLELQTSAGPADICIVDPSGALTIVECKLSQNSEHRRRIVGQVIDYAAAIRADGPDSFRSNWSGKGGANLDEILSAEAAGVLEGNIREGNINLCLAVDQIDGEIRRLVEYLNLITKDSIAVIALQLAYAKLGSIEVLIPSTYGYEIAASKAASSGAKGENWTWDGFVDALRDPSDKDLANQLFDRLQAMPIRGDYEHLWFGRKPGGGVFFHIHGCWYSPFQLWVNSAGRLLAYGNWRTWNALRNDPRFARLATALGQEMETSSRGVLLASLDFEEFWSAAVECDRQINNLE